MTEQGGDMRERVARVIWRETYRHDTLLEWYEIKPGTMHHRRVLATAEALIAAGLIVDRGGEYMPCPTCHQYSHSLGDDEIAQAFNHLNAMIAHPVRGHPMGAAFDEKTREAAMVLTSAIRAKSVDRDVVLQVAAALSDACDDDGDAAAAFDRGDNQGGYEALARAAIRALSSASDRKG